MPTDFEILDAFSDGKRNIAANIALDIEKDRSYINTRLPILEDYDLLEKIGPAPNSGVYEITEKGLKVLRVYHDIQSDNPQSVDFEAAIEEQTAD